MTRPGAFEAADGGTVFLDEIGELPLDLQPKLLRVLEERIVKRVGSHETTRVDVRILAATNRDLRKEVNRGTFRPDLYYRLNVVRLDVPPLRERREDIPVLAEAFWHQLAGPEAGPLPPHLIAHFTEQEWPGNVRELRATIERSLLLGEDLAPTAPAKEAAPAFDPALSFRDAKSRATGEWENQYLTALMHRCEFNLSRAAREARMDRTHLRELLLRYEILRE